MDLYILSRLSHGVFTRLGVQIHAFIQKYHDEPILQYPLVHIDYEVETL